MAVEHLVFFAGTARPPCHLTLHFRHIPRQKCQGIEIAANGEAIEVLLLRFLQRLPCVLEAAHVDVVACQVPIADDGGLQSHLDFGLSDRLIVLAQGGVNNAQVHVGHHILRVAF